MDQNKQLHIALGIVVTLILLLSIFTFGWVIGDSDESTNTNQLLVVNSLRTVNTATQPVVQETKLPNLGQSLTDQSRQNVETTIFHRRYRAYRGWARFVCRAAGARSLGNRTSVIGRCVGMGWFDIHKTGQGFERPDSLYQYLFLDYRRALYASTRNGISATHL